MSDLKGTAYEALCHDLVAGITRGTPLQDYILKSGARNRVAGASGYKHQIDLSLVGEERLFLFELKCLYKSIGVAEILILAARFSDISAAFPGHKVLASIVSTKRPSKNVFPLSRQFGLCVDVVENLNSYGLSFANQHFVGHVEKAHAQDHCDAKVIRGNGANPSVNTDLPQKARQAGYVRR
jgi:hypothetical protein